MVKLYKIGDCMKVISHNCPTCSAGLTYDIDTQNWMCDFCKKSFNLEQLMDHHKKHDANKTSVLSGYFCENCGADIPSVHDNAFGFTHFLLLSDQGFTHKAQCSNRTYAG